MSDLVVLGHSTGTISMAWTVTSRSLAASPDSCLRRKFVQAPASCCGLVLVGKLPWGQTLNPEPFPKDLKTITQKKVMQDKSCIVLSQMSQIFYKSPPLHAASLSLGYLKI